MSKSGHKRDQIRPVLLFTLKVKGNAGLIQPKSTQTNQKLPEKNLN